MSLATLKLIYEKLFSSGLLQKRVSFVWHAGEPLAVPIQFYKQAVAMSDEINETDSVISHAIQTNGTLITQEWCDFIKNARIKVGVSIDGPRDLNDHSRVDRRGRGTFDRVVKGIRLLQANGIPFHIIAVITEHTLSSAQRMWEFFEEYSIGDVCLNVEEIEGANLRSSLSRVDAQERYELFFAELMRLWDRDGRRRYIREFSALIGHILNAAQSVHSTENTPLSILSFDYKGSFSTFSPELLGVQNPLYGDFTFGNVHTNELGDILTSSKFAACADSIRRGVEMCAQTCEYFSVCGGGAPSNKLFENGTFNSAETMSCRLRKKGLTNVVLDFLETKLPGTEALTYRTTASV